jgi:protein phosphatase
MTNIGQIADSHQTDQGQVRQRNEDYVAVRHPQNVEDENLHGWLYIVADGVGGADAGEVASSYATERTLYHYLDKATQRNWGKRLQEAIEAAHQDLCKLIEERRTPNRMGTTMVAALITGQTALFANVGDSRGYHCRNGRIRQITKDHSLVVKLLEEGIITEEEAANLNISNIILQSIGSEQPPVVDLFTTPLLPGDRILLCSDGLNLHVKDHEMAEILSQYNPEEASRRLVQLANSRGGYDNVTVIVLKYGNQLQKSD